LGPGWDLGRWSSALENFGKRGAIIRLFLVQLKSGLTLDTKDSFQLSVDDLHIRHEGEMFVSTGDLFLFQDGLQYFMV
jgi:hypothetical protein